MEQFNSKLCHSIKSKLNTNLQCCNKPKINEVLCGKHLKSNNIVLFNKTSINISNNNFILNNTDILNNMELTETESTSIKKIYTKDELFEKILTNTYISVYSLRKSIKNCSLNNFIDTKQTKQELIRNIKDIIQKERYYIFNQKSIILIQSIYRMWRIHKRKLCSNSTDILTFIDIYDIEDKFFYIFNDVIRQKKYGYDIRTLIQIINSDYPSCPYTFRLFTEDEKFEINKYTEKLIKNGIDLGFEKNMLSPEEEIEMKIKDVFHKINMLDNYTNPEWFKNLQLNQLIELYVRAEDIWIYRSMMSVESKANIVHNGVAFSIPVPTIRTFKSKIKLQDIILDEFNRFVTEGINIEEKKLGAILILTALVEVSHDAADALPHLIQI
jgi:hypothetical protein